MHIYNEAITKIEDQVITITGIYQILRLEDQLEPEKLVMI